MLELVLRYAARGRRVLPVWWLLPDGTCACGGLPKCRAGKHPIGALAPRGVRSATTDPGIIERWYPEANVGMAMGDGVIAIDVDPRHRGDRTWTRLQAEHGELPRTPHARTGGGGDHFFVQVEGVFGF